MVRSSSAKLVHFEEDDQMRRESIGSGIYDLEDYSDEQRNFSNKMSMQETFDDTIATEEEYVVDAKDNPTQLYLRLHYRLWDMVLRSLKSNPQEATVWIVKSNGKNKVLPIHVACGANACPPAVVEALMAVYPHGLQCATARNGLLPLHLICANEYFLAEHGNLIMKMVNVSPKTLMVSNHRRETPMDVLKQHLCSNETKSSKQCQKILAKMEEKLAQMCQQLDEQETPRNKEETICNSSIVQSPSTGATDDGFASQLNQMRMAMMTEGLVEDKLEEMPIAHRPSAEKHLRHAKPIQDDDDERDYRSPSLSREQVEDTHFREQVSNFDGSSSEEELSQKSPRRVSQAKLKMTKTLKENCLLRKQLSQLTEKYTTVQSNHDGQCTLIDNLKRSVDQERDIDKTHVKDYELKLARIQDHLLDTQRQLQNKSRNESNLAQRISQLESSVAGKKADLFAIKAALQEEGLDKATLEEDLEEQQSENKILRHEIIARTEEQERLVVRLEDVSKELETFQENDGTTQQNLKKLDATLQEKEIQMRSLTESVGTSERKVDKLEKFNATLNTKANDLKEALRGNTDTFKATVAKLESELQKKEKGEKETLNQVEELKRVFEAKDRKLALLASERQLLESTCETLRGKEIVAEGVSKKLAGVSKEASELQTKLHARQEEIERLAGEIAGLKTESALKSGTINETERRMEALYTELVAQRKRETEIDQKNKDLSRGFENLTRDQQSKSTKLRILKSAVESYKIEMEQFVVKKSGDDKRAAENIRNVLMAEEQIGMQAIVMEELRTKLSSVEAREEATKSMADDQQHKIQEFVAELERKDIELDKSQQRGYVLTEKLEELERLRREHLDLTEKMTTKAHEYMELKSLCSQKSKAEDDSKAECYKVREYSKLQASSVADLECSLSQLKSKHTVLCEEYEKMKAITEKSEGLNISSAQEQQKAATASSLRIRELQTYIAELKEEKLQGIKRINEFEVVVNELREWYSNALSRVEELENGEKERLTSLSSDKATGEMAQKENTRILRVIAQMRETALVSNVSIKAERKANNILHEEIMVLKDKSKVSEDAVKKFGSSNGALQNENKALRCQVQRKEKADLGVIELLIKSNCENLLRINLLSNAEAYLNSKVEDLDSTIRNFRDNYDDLRSELADNVSKTADTERQRILQVRSYEDKIALLHETIAQVRTTLEEQRDVVTLRLEMSSEMTEERTVLKQAVDSSTRDLQRSRGKCERLETQIVQYEKERSTLCAKIEALNPLTDKLQISQSKCENLQTQAAQVEKERSALCAKVEALDSLTGDLQRSKGEYEILKAQLSQVEKERNALSAKIEASEEKASINYEVDRQDDQKKMMEKIDKLSQSLRTSMDRSEELQKRAEELKTLQSKEGESQGTIISLKASISELQNELRVQSEEAKRNEELNKSYQIEVGRLLKVNTALGEQCQEINVKTEKQNAQVEELKKCKEEYEKQSAASSMKLLDILSKFSSDNDVPGVVQEKEELQREYEKISEDNVANSANVEYLVKNIQLLETRVMDLTSTHMLLLEEADRLRNTINEQNERVVELEDIIRLNTASDVPSEEADAENSLLTSTASTEWDKQIIDLVSKYTGTSVDKESLLMKAENRSATRETLRMHVNDAFESQFSKIAKLDDHAKASEGKATDFEKNLKNMRLANQTLKLENKILKTAGKERDQRAKKMQSKLNDENESLKQAIGKLTKQTADHQLKIRRLALKQASLTRKKEAARKHDKTKAFEQMKLAASEDMGSLAFSADSQDAGDNTAQPSAGPTHDRSVEVVLLDETLESRDDQTLS